MGRGAKKERNSCLFKEDKQIGMQVQEMCNPCYELYKYGSTPVHRYGLKTTGVCFLLHPNNKENWTPYDPKKTFWYDRLEKNSSDATTTTTTTIDTIVTVMKRKRTPVVPYIAEPGSAKMECERQPTLSHKRTNRRSHQNMDQEKATILSKVGSLPKRVQHEIFSPILDSTANIREGRTCIAQKIRKLSGKSGPITLSTKGVSDTAVSLSRKTLRETQEGFALLLNPIDSLMSSSSRREISTVESPFESRSRVLHSS